MIKPMPKRADIMAGIKISINLRRSFFLINAVLVFSIRILLRYSHVKDLDKSIIKIIGVFDIK